MDPFSTQTDSSALGDGVCSAGATDGSCSRARAEAAGWTQQHMRLMVGDLLKHFKLRQFWKHAMLIYSLICLNCSRLKGKTSAANKIIGLLVSNTKNFSCSSLNLKAVV